jgi:hypothetical protein
MKVYVAASWRTPSQPLVVQLLRQDGHEVYDFRDDGFAWEAIDARWQAWTPEEFVAALYSPLAIKGFRRDKAALDWCEVCVLLQPSGRSAHLELGYAVGVGKYGIVLLEERQEPDLMYGLAHHVCTHLDQVRWLLQEGPLPGDLDRLVAIRL